MGTGSRLAFVSTAALGLAFAVAEFVLVPGGQLGTPKRIGMSTLAALATELITADRTRAEIPNEVADDFKAIPRKLNP
jgi:hypothetical protein